MQALKLNVSNEIGLFDDVAVLLKRGKRNEVHIAGLIRMRNKARNYVEFKKPVPLNSQTIYPNLQLTLSLYKKEEDFYVYDVSQSETETTTLKEVIMKVALTLNNNVGKYSLNETDRTSLKEFENNIKKRMSSGSLREKSKRSLTQSNGAPAFEAADGRVVITSGGEHENNSMDGRRRSQRERRVILYEAQ